MSSSSRPNGHSNCSEDCLLYQEIHIRMNPRLNTLEVNSDWCKKWLKVEFMRAISMQKKNSLYFFSQTHRRAAYFCINRGESSLHRSAEHYAIAIPKRVVPVLMTRCKYFLFPPICLLLFLVVCSETRILRQVRQISFNRVTSSLCYIYGSLAIQM